MQFCFLKRGRLTLKRNQLKRNQLNQLKLHFNRLGDFKIVPFQMDILS